MLEDQGLRPACDPERHARFRQILEEAYPHLVAQARRTLRRPDEAEEAVHEAVADLLEQGRCCQPPGEPRDWHARLTAAVAYRVKRILRRRQRERARTALPTRPAEDLEDHPAMRTDGGFETEATPADVEEGLEDRLAVRLDIRRALDLIPAEIGSVLWDVYALGRWTWDDAARNYQLHPDAVRCQVTRYLPTLRRHLGDYQQPARSRRARRWTRLDPPARTGSRSLSDGHGFPPS